MSDAEPVGVAPGARGLIGKSARRITDVRWTHLSSISLFPSFLPSFLSSAIRSTFS
ncbi:hypothetical protein [Streptomyces sp. NPDC054962]